MCNKRQLIINVTYLFYTIKHNNHLIYYKIWTNLKLKSGLCVSNSRGLITISSKQPANGVGGFGDAHKSGGVVESNKNLICTI